MDREDRCLRLLTSPKGSEDLTEIDCQTDRKTGSSWRLVASQKEEKETDRELAGCTPSSHKRPRSHTRDRYVIKRIKTKGPDVQMTCE